MKTFYRLLMLNLKIHYYYRWNFLFTLLLDPVLWIIQIQLLSAVYTHNATGTILGYSLTRMIWYFAAAKFFFYLVWSVPDQEIAKDVIFGMLGVKLVKPVSLLQWEFTKTVANKISSLVFSFIPNFVIFALLVAPDFLTPVSLLKYFILNFFAFILFYLMSFLLGIISLRWQSTGALTTLKIILMNVASGTTFPLDFLPGTIRTVLEASPFPYLSYIPIQFFLNMPQTRDGSVFFNVLMIQVLWIVVFYVSGKLLWCYLFRFHTVAGG